jgi:phytoene dehydrogenase-like protein
MDYDVIIVGSGVAGLTAGAYLAKSGRTVLVCEKEPRYGGLVNSFERNGFVFDGGIRALENAGALFPMLSHLGLEIEFVKNHISIGIEDQILNITSDESADEYGSMLTHYFPESKDEIIAIINDIRKIMKYMDVQYGIDNPLFLDIKTDQQYFLKKVLPWVFKYALTVRKIMTINQPVLNYLKGFTANQALLDNITQHFFTETPAFFALSYIKLFLDYYYPKGGTGVLPDKLANFIRQHGGEIKTETEILSIDLEKNTISDADSHTYGYKQLLWAADLKKLYQSIDQNAVHENELKLVIEQKRKALSDKTGNNSIFTLFLTVNLDKRYFENIATEHFFYTPSHEGQSKAGEIPINGSWKDIQSWLEKFFALTTYEISIPVIRDSALAPKGKTGLIISVLFDYQLTKFIESKGWYPQFKEYVERLIINTLEKSVYPGISKAVIERFSSTPLSLQRLTGNTDGGITGWSFTNHPIPAENRLPSIASAIKTPLPRVYQAGQWTFSPSGFPIALITGKLAADKINSNLNK